jgi:hypothetical protein
MSPRTHINDLSFDLIQEVFHLVVLHSSTSSNDKTITPFTAPHSPRYHSPASPYAISHVCRQWRHIALGYSRLWSHLCVLKPRTTRLRHLLQEWIERAKPFPLHLSLHEIDTLTPFATKTILSLFLNAVHRCTSFKLNIRSDTLKVVDTNNLRIQQPLLLLERVSIRTNDYSERPKARSVLELLFSAPSLRSTTWDSPGPMRFKKSSKCWTDLRELSFLTPLYPEDLPTILSTCQSLESLVINRPKSSCRHITLPRLRFLTVTIGSSDSLNWLTAPTLTDLEIVLVRRVRLNIITAMTDRSDARLRTLRVKKHITEDTHLTKTEERILLAMLGGDCFVELRELEVEQYVGLETLRFLTLPPNTQPNDRRNNLPLLKSVRLTFFPNSRLLDIRHTLDALLVSRISAYRNYKPHDYVWFSDETLDFVLLTPRLLRRRSSLELQNLCFGSSVQDRSFRSSPLEVVA